MPSRRIRITIATLLVASLTFVILDLRGGDGPLSSARAAVSAVVGVLQEGVNVVVMFGPFHQQLAFDHISNKGMPFQLW